MSIGQEESLSRIATNLAMIAGAISTLAEAVNGTYKGKPIYAETDATPSPSQTPAEGTSPKRSRGRPVKGEDQAPVPTVPVQASSTTPATPAVAEPDPFDAPAKPVAPTATLEEVRAALTALKAATSQDIALGVLKSAGGAENLSGLSQDKYGAVVAAAAAKAAEYSKAPEPDPFDVPPVERPLTLDDVKNAVVKAQKRAGTDAVQKVVMDHGGKATNPDTGAPGASLKALPESQFAAVIAAVEKLPTTK